MYNDLGKTLLIVNPVAQSGKSKAIGFYVFDLLTSKYNQDVDIFYTKHQGHANHLALGAHSYDSVIVVGGDGIVHETVCGLMDLQENQRPVLGVIPVGSGNDYARSLGISFKYKKAVEQIMKARVLNVDVGKVNDQYFVETLSFGLDAGIAIDTMNARKKSKEKGFKLYFKCGINRIKNHYEYFKFNAVLDGERKIESESLIFSVQIGKTYGGGFKITPDAQLDDGIFDLCYTQGKFGRRKAIPLFAKAAKGKHVNSKYVKMDKAESIKLNIDKIVPCQIDGEELHATEFDISILSRALQVYNAKFDN